MPKLAQTGDESREEGRCPAWPCVADSVGLGAFTYMVSFVLR